MPMEDATLEKKLCRIVHEDKVKPVTVKGKRVYASKKSLKEIREQEKEGGIFPLIPIFAGLAAAGSIAGGSAAIANAVNSKKSQDAQLERERAHDTRVEQLLKGDDLQLPEYQKSNGFSEGIKAFAEKSGLSSIESKILRTALKPLSNKLDAIVKGEGLILVSKLQ